MLSEIMGHIERIVGIMVILQVCSLDARQFERCELAALLLSKQPNIEYNDLNKWICIARNSNFNSSAIIQTGDNERLLGLFGLSDRTVCAANSNHLSERKCNVLCEKLLDDQLTDDFSCARDMFTLGATRSTEGSNAWPIEHRQCEDGVDIIRECNVHTATMNDLIGRPDEFRWSRKYKRSPTAPRYTRCELFRKIEQADGMSWDLAAVWTCLAINEPSMRNPKIANDNPLGRSDIRLRDIYPCKNSDVIPVCYATCYDLKELNDDEYLNCMQKIYNKERTASGNGFNAWSAYNSHCREQSKSYSDGCYNLQDDDDDGGVKKRDTILTLSERTEVDVTPPKIYERCELARELLFVHNFPATEINTWVCIVENESEFNTSASGELNEDGSKDHGLFQISDKFWCSPGLGCNIDCAQLHDANITDDVQCVKKIFDEQRRISGDGFAAWASYEPYCYLKSNNYTRDCFSETENKQLEQNITEIQKKNMAVAELNALEPVEGRNFTTCEMAKQLYHVYLVSKEKLDTWMCIIENESNFSTSAVSSVHLDGSREHGLFKISDNYWCSPPGRGEGCGIDCAKLRNVDITDDIQCAMKIYSKEGFNAWASYGLRCKTNVTSYSSKCLDDDAQIQLAHRKSYIPTTGKIYTELELATELRTIYKIPEEKIAIWVCIAKRESNLNTSAVGEPNGNGNRPHGIFKISGEFWCSEKEVGNACSAKCSSFEDSDISDDLACAQKIYDDTKGWAGDGFNAWSSYTNICKANAVVPSEMTTNVAPARGKIYTESELTNELRDVQKIPEEQIAIWVCIAKRESNLNTSAVGEANANGNRPHGIFKISGEFWCSEKGIGKACSAKCSSFEDSDISDDLACAQKIYDDTKGWAGDGFNAWSSYTDFCKTNSKNVFLGADTANRTETSATEASAAASSSGKIFERCELALELRNIHNIPIEQIGIWVCIAEKANYNTSLLGPLNTAGHRNRGILQVNDEWWCGKSGQGGICNIECSKLTDADITDDLSCGRTIISETMDRTNDGFSAWPIYTARCKVNASNYSRGCGFDDQLDDRSTAVTTTTSTEATTTVRTKTEILADGGVVFEVCDMAKELLNYDIPIEELDIWMCIIERESQFNSSSVSRLHQDGSREHGLFRVSNNYWCSPPGKGTGCNIDCAKLMDADISDDIACVKTIFAADGFAAWGSYNRWCKASRKAYSRICDLVPTAPLVPVSGITVTKGKVYELCDLAQELLYTHKIPKGEINTWVCLMESESAFNTSAVTGSFHGILQISDQLWCSNSITDTANECNISCDKLEDSDITDDIACAKRIHSLESFNAWTSYNTRCRYHTATYTKDCFLPEEQVTDPPEATTPKQVKERGKVYGLCELARELRYVHRFPADQVNTWTCIVENESGFNTAAVGMLNTDNSTDNGLFQLSSTYWCGEGKNCGISCDDLLDSDIFDDVQCAKMVFAAQQRLTQNGFEAWTTYELNSCDRKNANYTSYCFDGLDERGMPLTSSTVVNQQPISVQTPIPITTIASTAPAQPPSAFIPVPVAQSPTRIREETIPDPTTKPQQPFTMPPTESTVPTLNAVSQAANPASTHHNLAGILKLVEDLSTNSTSSSILGRINLNFINVYNFFFHNQTTNTFNINN